MRICTHLDIPQNIETSSSSNLDFITRNYSHIEPTWIFLKILKHQVPQILISLHTIIQTLTPLWVFLKHWNIFLKSWSPFMKLFKYCSDHRRTNVYIFQRFSLNIPYRTYQYNMSNFHVMNEDVSFHYSLYIHSQISLYSYIHSQM